VVMFIVFLGYIGMYSSRPPCLWFGAVNLGRDGVLLSITQSHLRSAHLLLEVSDNPAWC